MSSKIDHDGKIVVEPAYKRVVRDANACGLNVKEKQSAATKAGDFKCPKCGWLARNADGCAVCTPPAEPALAAEGAVVLSDAERAELCDFCIWLGDHQENPGTRRRLGRIAQIFNATAAPEQPARGEVSEAEVDAALQAEKDFDDRPFPARRITKNRIRAALEAAARVRADRSQVE